MEQPKITTKRQQIEFLNKYRDMLYKVIPNPNKNERLAAFRFLEKLHPSVGRLVKLREKLIKL